MTEEEYLMCPSCEGGGCDLCKGSGLHKDVPFKLTDQEGTCRHCNRRIVYDENHGWVDPEATGDDRIWRESCDAHDTFTAEHEPKDVRITSVLVPCYWCDGDGMNRDCAYCAGTGEADANGFFCDTCDGTGNNPLPNQRCQLCQGSGIDKQGSWKSVTSTDVEPEMKALSDHRAQCDQCKGSIDDLCPEGDRLEKAAQEATIRKMFSRTAQEDKIPFDGVVPCAMCEGTGSYKGCGKCFASGIVSQTLPGRPWYDDDNFRECQACDGLGEGDDDIRCDNCKGSGLIRMRGGQFLLGSKTALFDYDPVRDVSPSGKSAPAPSAQGSGSDPWPDLGDNGTAPPRPGWTYDKKLKKWLQDEQLTYPSAGPMFPGVTDINKVGKDQFEDCEACGGFGYGSYDYDEETDDYVNVRPCRECKGSGLKTVTVWKSSNIIKVAGWIDQGPHEPDTLKKIEQTRRSWKSHARQSGSKNNKEWLAKGAPLDVQFDQYNNVTNSYYGDGPTDNVFRHGGVKAKERFDTQRSQAETTYRTCGHCKGSGDPCGGCRQTGLVATVPNGTVKFPEWPPKPRVRKVKCTSCQGSGEYTGDSLCNSHTEVHTCEWCKGTGTFTPDRRRPKVTEPCHRPCDNGKRVEQADIPYPDVQCAVGKATGEECTVTKRLEDKNGIFRGWGSEPMSRPRSCGGCDGKGYNLRQPRWANVGDDFITCRFCTGKGCGECNQSGLVGPKDDGRTGKPRGSEWTEEELHADAYNYNAPHHLVYQHGLDPDHILEKCGECRGGGKKFYVNDQGKRYKGDCYECGGLGRTFDDEYWRKMWHPDLHEEEGDSLNHEHWYDYEKRNPPKKSKSKSSADRRRS